MKFSQTLHKSVNWRQLTRNQGVSHNNNNLSIAYSKKKIAEFTKILHCRDVLCRRCSDLLSLWHTLCLSRRHWRKRIRGRQRNAERIENHAVVDGVETREWFGLPVDDKLRSLNVSPFPSIFSSKANRRAATKSAFCVLVVAFLRVLNPLVIFMQFLMPRSLLSWVWGTSMLNENWRPRFVLCIVWVQMGYFPQPQCIKFTINIFFEQREPRIFPKQKLELWNSG